MPNWKRIIVGDAFTTAAPDSRHYLDVALGVPCFIALVELLVAFSEWPPPLPPREISLVGLALVACWLAAKRRKVVFGAPLAIIVLRGFFGFLLSTFVAAPPLRLPPVRLIAAWGICVGALYALWRWKEPTTMIDTRSRPWKAREWVIGLAILIGITAWALWSIRSLPPSFKP